MSWRAKPRPDPALGTMPSLRRSQPSPDGSRPCSAKSPVILESRGPFALVTAPQSHLTRSNSLPFDAPFVALLSYNEPIFCWARRKRIWRSASTFMK